MRVSEYAAMSQGGLFVCPEVRVTYGTDWSWDCMRPDFVEAALHRY